MPSTRVVIIGGGQAGLAVSHLLTAASIDHVVLERGRAAERWRSQRWDSLRLLTPNWMSRLPGWSYRGAEPDGFMPAGAVADFLSGYAVSFHAPLLEGRTVLSVRRHSDRFLVDTDSGRWSADAVVIATGFCDEPAVPAAARHLDPRIHQLTPDRYRNPSDLPPGGVLVVGAAATGAQLADELAADGRPVLLAVGRHTRLPRRYRGRDIMWWLDRIGALHRPVDGHRASRASEPSLQLVGHEGGQGGAREVDLPSLVSRGIRLAGRVRGIDGSHVEFAGDLPDTAAAADARLTGLLRRIDAHAAAAGLDHDAGRPDPVQRFTPEPGTFPARVDLRAAAIGTVLWATGYRRRYPWLQVPVLDAAGEILHTAGVTPAPGLVVVGQRLQTRRSSTFLDGVGHDAALVVDHLITTVLGESLRRAS